MERPAALSGTLHAGGRTVHLPSPDWMETIRERGYRGVIFDCDGTLVDSGKAHFLAFRDAARAQGLALEWNWYRQRTALDRRSLLTELSALAGRSFDIEAAIKASIAAFANHVHLVEPIPQTASLLRRLCGQLPVAIGTNAETEIAGACLTAAGLAEFGVPVFSVSGGLHPKPAPDIFAAAAAWMDLSGSDVLVIEDSGHGVDAAKAAGMDVLQLARTGSKT